jgi:chromo domain-containing protein 1
MIASAYQLDFATMFCGNDENVSLDRQAFILFHPDDHAEDLELIVRWLLIHHVEVYTLRVDGAWDHFKSRILKGETGVIIAHPTFKRFWCIPDFGKVLLKNVRVWSVGFQRAVDSEPQYGCIEMFPHGGMIYITDDVFEKEPLKALEMIALFIRKIDQCKSVPGPANPEHFVNDRCLLWRLAVRPELMRALWDWCDAHGEEIDAGEPAAQARAQLYMLLSESHYIEQDVPGEWVLQPDDFWPIISERQEVSEVYFQALRHGQKYANETQVELFAGTVIDYRRDYRHFSIVHTEPAKVDWQSRWHNIDEVMTPDEYIAYMRQGNRFEFYIPEDTESAESEKDILPMSSSAPMDISSPETV